MQPRRINPHLAELLAVSILTRRGRRVQRSTSFSDIETFTVVSILTRRGRRVQLPKLCATISAGQWFQSSPAADGGCNAPALRLGNGPVFQSSPAADGGCNEVRREDARQAYRFQSSPAADGGCNLGNEQHRTLALRVSILTRRGRRVQPN